MKLGGRILTTARAAAMLAVALLSIASIRSVVMQAAEASPFAAMPICAADTGAAPLHGQQQQPAPAKTAADSCAFCAAAAHAPLIAFASPLSVPGFTAWLAGPPPPSCTLRSASTVPPRARGPPLPLLTI